MGLAASSRLRGSREERCGDIFEAKVLVVASDKLSREEKLLIEENMILSHVSWLGAGS
jgi:hypothetical protein